MARRLLAALLAFSTFSAFPGARAGAQPIPRIIEIPRAVGGYLDGDDGQWEGGRLYEDFVFTGSPRLSLVAEMVSGQIDAVLHLGRYVNGELEILASNDDGFDAGTDARIVAELPATGEYVLRATSYDIELGGFLLLVAWEGMTFDWQPVPIRVGDRIDGELTLQDSVFAEDVHFDEYQLDVAAGQRVVVTMTSDEFDTYLSIEQRVGQEMVELDANDDGPAMGTNSQIDITFAEAGTYYILASSYLDDIAGAYTLSVEAR